MSQHSLSLLLSAAVVNNIALWYCLGLCPLLGISGDLRRAFQLGLAMVGTAIIAFPLAWAIRHAVLASPSLLFLRAVVLLVACVVGSWLLGIILAGVGSSAMRELGRSPGLVFTNCALYGIVAQSSNPGVSFGDGLMLTLGGALGFLLVAVIFAGIRGRLELPVVPKRLRGFPSDLLTVGALSLVFLGVRAVGLG
jgi:electron transport complex protein RnfA